MITRFLFAALAVILGLAACDEGAPVQAVQPEPPVVQRLRAVWEAERARIAARPRQDGKAAYSEAELAFGRALETEAAAGGLDELMRYATAMDERGDGEVEFLIQQELLDHLIRSEDRERLLELLSKVVIRGSSYWSLETMLAWPQVVGREDAIPLLFDAFDEARSEHVRESLYLAAWRAFGDAPSTSRDPAAYMHAARGWYAANRDRLQRVDHYEPEDLVMWRNGILTGLPPHHLFELK